MHKGMAALSVVTLLLSCSPAPVAVDPAAAAPAGRRAAARGPDLVDDIQRRTLLFFWETANPENGLVPDRWPTESFSNIAAVGFGLTAYDIGAERGWVTREQAAQRVLTTLRFFLESKQGPEAAGVTGNPGARTFYGQPHLQFAPLFGHQYWHAWIDFHSIRDAYMREKGIDYFENSGRATIAQRAYAIENPMKWRGYGENVWGLTACGGPLDGFLDINGTRRHFWTYHARGATAGEIRDDGTIGPTAAVSSIAFTPEIAIPATQAMLDANGEHLYQKYGFLDSFNPTLNFDTRLQMGHIVPGVGWFSKDYLGIDRGPIVIMIENYRSGLVWEVMKRNPHIMRDVLTR